MPQFTGWVMKTFGSTRWPKNLKLSNPKIRKRKSPPRPQFHPGWGQNSLHFWREVQTRIQPSLLRPQVAATMFMFCLPIRIPRHKGMGYFFFIFSCLIFMVSFINKYMSFYPQNRICSQNIILGLKMMVKIGLENFTVKFLHAGRWLFL